MVLGSLGLMGAFAVPAPAGAASNASSTSTNANTASLTSASTSPSAASSLSSVPSAHASSAVSLGSSAALGKAALAATKAAGIPSQYVYLPNANSATKPVSETGGVVSPLYGYAPAPMGIGYYGVSNTTGTPVATILNTPSVAASFSTNSTVGAQPFYLDNGLPDAYGVQLNAVLTNVSLWGQTSTDGTPNQFWTQNVVLYTASLHQLQFIDNVWAFWPGFAPNTFAAHGPNGTFVYPEYYYAVGPTITISYPFTLDLYLNSTVLHGDNAVYFNYTLSSSSYGTHSASYDYVIFNSTGQATRNEAQYQANGFHYDPLGLTNDFEITIGGPGGGSTTNFAAIDASMTLSYWNTSTHHYEAVPAAYNYGGETGETSSGANVWYQGTTAHLTTGPSILQGLWNNQGTPDGSPGFEMVHLNINPSNAFLLFDLASNIGMGGPGPTFQWAPTIGPSLPNAGWLTGSIPLTPGLYFYAVALSDYDVSIGFLNLTSGPGWINVTLNFDPGAGMYTPLYAWENSQLANISWWGDGTATNPYQLFDNPNASGLAFPFAGVNDYFFPTFAGILLYGTTAYVNVTESPASLFIQFPAWVNYTANYFYLPHYNNLQVWVAYADNVSIVDSEFSGWFFYENSWADPANVMLFNDQNVLVAENLFDVSATGLFVYNGHSQNAGGGVTVWENDFENYYNDFYACPFCNIELQFLGLQLAASGDLVFNNYFDTEYTAWTPTTDYWNLFLVPINYTDTWNVSQQPASNVVPLPEFPLANLTGSVIGTSYMGGNYWWDYGLYPNPYNVLPYNEGGLITIGGDYVPLLGYELFTVSITVTNAPAGQGWQLGIFYSDLYNIVSGVGTQTVNVSLPNGTYYAQGYVNNFYAQDQLFTVDGAATGFTYTFPNLYLVTFHAVGYDANVTAWEVDVTGPNDTYVDNYTSPGNNTLTVDLPAGSFNYSVYIYSDTVTIAESSGVVVVTDHAVTVRLVFIPAYLITFTPVGLPGDVWWWLESTYGTSYTTGAYNITAYYANGTQTVQYASESPMYAPYEGPDYTNYANLTFTVQGANLVVVVTFTEVYSVVFSESGLPSFDTWTVTLNSVTSNTSAAGSTVGFWIGNATYNYTVVSDDVDYNATPSSGAFTVSGSGLNFSVRFTTNASFKVVIIESGLPRGATWIAILNNIVSPSTSTFINYSIPGAGVYPFAITTTAAGYVATPSTGTVNASIPTTVLSIVFAIPIPTYQVYFTQSGLWSGTAWGVTLGGTTINSSGPVIVFTELAGNYNYTIGSPAGYYSTPSNGTLAVAASQSISVQFTLITYTVTFEETGLPVSTSWAVTLGNAIFGTSGTSLSFTVVPGTYNFLVGNITGWSSNPSAGVVTVTNHNVVVSLTFSPDPPTFAPAPTFGAASVAATPARV